MSENKGDGKKYYFDDPRNIKKVLTAFGVVLGLLAVADFFIHKHVIFGFDGFPEYYALYGFVCYVSLVYIARGLQPFIKRDINYYDD